MLSDFHTHSLLSDGELTPLELIRRYLVRGCRLMAITDHVSYGTLAGVVAALTRDCALAEREWGATVIPGVELTHFPPHAIAAAAREAKELGARLVIVHGETIAEPVAPGTNLAALQSPHVDILAHPGLISLAEARLAASQGILLELSARKGHSLTNGHVAKAALQAGAKLLLSSDAHSPGDLLASRLAENILRGAGLTARQTKDTLTASPAALLARLGLPPMRERP